MTKEEEVKAAWAELKALRRELGKVGLLSHEYVQDRGPGAGCPCYQWTRKVNPTFLIIGKLEKVSEENWRQRSCI